MNYFERSLVEHKKHKGKITTHLKVPMENKDDLSTYYSPGVAEPCREIEKDKSKAYEYTNKGNLVAVISDGTAVLGLGDIGADAAMPVMEGKAALFKAFGDVDSVPLVLNTKDSEEIVQIVKALAPSFGGINLEDISAPRCFEIEAKLIEALDIPVFHDDQYGTAICVLAGLINALELVGKKKEEVKVVINGTGAAGVAILRLLKFYGFEHFKMLDSKGLIFKGRDRLNWIKEEVAEYTNLELQEGGLSEALEGADVFLGVSKANLVSEEMVESMAEDPIIFAMANPTPEIMPDLAKKAGAAVVATGRSDFPNQVNNVLVFPGIFRGALDAGAGKITMKMKVAAAEALAALVEEPNENKVIPSPFEKGVMETVAKAVKDNV